MEVHPRAQPHCSSWLLASSDAALFISSPLACNAKGCASVLKTHSSSDMVLGGLKSRYKYLRVSANQKDCILLSCAGGITPTSLTPLYPPLAICRQKQSLIIWPVTSSQARCPIPCTARHEQSQDVDSSIPAFMIRVGCECTQESGYCASGPAALQMWWHWSRPCCTCRMPQRSATPSPCRWCHW